MRVDSIQNTNFGLRKLTSFKDLAKQRGAKIASMEANGVRDYINYIKKAVINMRKNASRAIATAKNIFIK